MYDPLIKAFNYALDKLSELDVPGLPKFQEGRRIVFAHSDAKFIKSNNHLQNSYKPDIILIKWDVFKIAHGSPSAAYSKSYQSDLCCKSNSEQPVFTWCNVLSTVEVKRSDSRGTGQSGNKGSKGKAKEKSVKWTYSDHFWKLSGDLKAPGSSNPPQPAPEKIITEEYLTRSRMSVVFCLPSHSHQLQFRYVLA